MKNKILAIMLSVALVFTTVNFCFAEEGVDNAAPEPEKQTEKVVEKKAEAPAVEKKEVNVEKEVVVKEEAPKVQEAEKAEAEKVKVEAEKAEVKLDKEPPKELGPPPEAGPGNHGPEGPTPEQPGEPVNPPEQGHFDGFTVANWEGYYDGHSHSVILNPNPLPNGYYYQYRPKINNHAHWTYNKLSYKNVGTYKVGVRVVDKHGAPVRGGDEKTAYVIIKPVPTEKLKLVFTYQNANGNKAEITPAPEIGNGETYTAVSAPTGPIGKVFSHWAKTSGNGPATINAGDVINGKTTETQEIWAYHAVYEDDVPELFPLHYSFTYADANGNKTMFAEGYIAEGETYEVGAPTNIPKGKVFSHWAKNKVSSESASEVLNAGDVIKGTSTEKEGEQWIYYAVYKDELIPLEIHIEGNVDSRVYNGEEQTLGGFNVVSDLPEGVDVKWGHLTMYAAKGTNVGKYYMTLSENKFILTGENAGKYEPTFILDKQGMLEITPKEIVITANDKSKMLGEQTPVFDETITGLDTQADRNWFEKHVTYTIACDYEEAVGDYPIVVAAEVVPEPIIIGPITPRPRPELVDIERPHYEYLEEAIMEYAKEEVFYAKSAEKKVPAEAVSEVVKPVVEVIEKPIAELKPFKKSNYSVKTVNGVFKIRDKVVPPVDPDNPDNPVVGPTDNGDNTPGLGDGDSTVNKASGIVKTGDADACWALLNLILAIATCVIAFMLIISMLMRKDDEEIEDTKAFFESSWFERILSGVVGIFALLVFLITENMNLPMVGTDRWTFIMVVIFALQILVAVFAKNKDKAVEEE